MSARALLFVDDGRGPMVLRPFSPERCTHTTSRPAYGVRATCDACRGTGYIIPSIVELLRHWWLVECESADSGRDIIAMSQGLGFTSSPGRILASGRKDGGR